MTSARRAISAGKSRNSMPRKFVFGMSLQELSRQLSVPAGETPALVATQLERISTLEKANKKLAPDLAQREGREQWDATAPDPDGIRRAVIHLAEQGAIDDALRTRAQAFVAQGQALFLAVSRNPPSVLLA